MRGVKRSINKYPNDAPYDWGYIMGCMASDGTTIKNPRIRGVAVAGEHELGERFLTCVNNVAGTQGSIYTKHGCFCATVYHTRFALLLDSICDWGTREWAVPDMVFGNKEMAKGFINGYFDGDGNFDDYETPAIRFASVNQNGLNDVSKLLLNTFGINSKVYSQEKYNRFVLRVQPEWSRLRYLELIDITLSHKRARVPDKYWEILSLRKLIQASADLMEVNHVQ